MSPIKNYILLVSLFIVHLSSSQTITVDDTNFSPQQMVDLLLSSSCSTNSNVNISSNLIDKKSPDFCENIEVFIIENKDNFSEGEWKSLYKLSQETFVEETDSLKQGAAGAGLTDND